jgi:hypothetical protein
MWLMTVLIAFSIREDLLGVTSLVRTLGMEAYCYDRILDFFHSPAIKVPELKKVWAGLVINHHPGLLRSNGRLLLVADGIKIAKSGRKMPGVKKLHQACEGNTKPQFIMGHSCQAVGALVKGLSSVLSIPMAAQIHEGVVYSNRDQRTLLDKMMSLVGSLAIDAPYYFIADAYYASGKVVKPLLASGNHLVTRVRSNAVAYHPALQSDRPRRGRPKVYGDKVRLKELFNDQTKMETVQSPVYGEKDVNLLVRSIDLLWRPVGVKVRFVAVKHPTRGKCLLMSSDLELEPVDIIRLYGYRFKIEVSFKQSIHVVGAFLYHFWMRTMKPIHRNSGDQYMHRKSEQYRKAIRRKMDAYHRFIQVGLIA